jgi:curved DNA-binding protein CbpA
VYNETRKEKGKETMKNIFIDCKDLKEVKNLFIKLVKENHPDLGGNLELMQSINAEYDLIKDNGLEYYHAKAGFTTEFSKETANADLNFSSEDYLTIIKFCLNTGLDIELCGSWLWISGNTKGQKDHLKELGCKWSASKSMWYFTDHHTEDVAVNLRLMKFVIPTDLKK